MFTASVPIKLSNRTFPARQSNVCPRASPSYYPIPPPPSLSPSLSVRQALPFHCPTPSFTLPPRHCVSFLRPHPPSFRLCSKVPAGWKPAPPTPPPPSALWHSHRAFGGTRTRAVYSSPTPREKCHKITVVVIRGRIKSKPQTGLSDAHAGRRTNTRRSPRLSGGSRSAAT